MQPHEYANIFPPLSRDELAALVADIRENGLINPIVTYEGQILDGRNRHLACNMAQVEPQFVEFDGDDPLAYVLSQNLHRRHLNESQRAMVANKLATLGNGVKASCSDLSSLTQGEAAERLNVSRSLVQKARKVEANGAPELAKAVENGEVALDMAERIAKQPQECQAAIMAADNPKAEIKRLQRQEKEASVRGKAGALPDKKYAVILADPPWRFEVRSPNGMDRAADNHYPTMTTDDIAALDVPSKALDDCVLFLWATVPILESALDVMCAWGFTYKSNIVWLKDRVGTGYWVRNAHEILLIGTRGNPGAPLPENVPESVIQGPVLEHSKKPRETMAIIERMCGDVPRLEMFARQTAPGWDCWGNEVK